MFRLKLQTFAFKHYYKHHISLVLETAHALLHSLEIYKGTSPVCSDQTDNIL